MSRARLEPTADGLWWSWWVEIDGRTVARITNEPDAYGRRTGHPRAGWAVYLTPTAVYRGGTYAGPPQNGTYAGERACLADAVRDVEYLDRRRGDERWPDERVS